MDETEQLVVGYRDGQYVALNARGLVIVVLAAGMVFEVWIRGQWQAVSLCSGGYRGLYYETTNGEQGRLAACMSIRACDPPVERIDEVLEVVA